MLTKNIQAMIKNPPGPKGKFLLGSVTDFREDTLGFIEKSSNEYGGIVKTKMVNRTFYFITDPELIHTVLTKHNNKYVKSFVYKGLEDFLGKGLLNNEREDWIKQRKLIQPCFHRKELTDLADLMVSATNLFLKGWDQKEGPFEMQQEIMLLTNSVITASIFGNDAEEQIDVKKLYDVMAILRGQAHDKMVNPFRIPDYVPTTTNRRYKKAKEYLHKTITALIEERRKTGVSTNDLLGQLLRLQFEDGGGMTNQQLYDEIVTLFVAGQETTTNALSFIFYLLSQNSEVYLKTIKEIDAVFENNDSPGLDDFMKLTYVGLVIKEALRLYCPAWAVSRENTEEDNLGGYIIPKGSVVLSAIYTLHRNPKYWDKPEDFIPERFEQPYNPKAYIPFGAGPRMCIGNHFALQEMQIAVALILRNYQLTLVSSPEINLITPITLNTKEPLIFKRKKR